VLTFTAIDGGIRNRGGTNEQFCGAIRYDQEIRRSSDNGVIHVENGMYLWMDNIYVHQADKTTIQNDIGFPEMKEGAGAKGPYFVPGVQICRSGTIPHGNSVNMLGNVIPYGQTALVPGSDWHPGAPPFPHGDKTWEVAHLAISKSMGSAGVPPGEVINLDKPPPPWVFDHNLPIRDPSASNTYTQRILAHANYPYSVRPDLRLRDTIKNQTIREHVHIQLDTRATDGAGPQGGIISVPFLKKYVPSTRAQFNLWIEKVVVDGHVVMQLQYEQIINFEFGFGTDGGTTVWPHIQVNTLRKKA
jgi:hypothetical protein